MIKKILNAFFYSLVTTILVSFILFNLFKSLRSYPEWVSKKVQIEKFLKGAQAFMDLRVSLDGNKINLDKFWGHQELILNKKLDYDQVSLTYELGNEGYVDLFIAKDRESRLGIRISNHNFYENMFFYENPDGSFSELKKLPFSKKNKKGNVTISIKGREVTVFRNEQKESFRHHLKNENREFAVRGCYRLCAVDEINLLKDGKSLYYENFDFKYDERFFFILFISWFVYSLVLMMVEIPRIHSYLRVINLTLFVFVLGDYFVFSGLYPKNPFNAFEHNQKIIKKINERMKLKEVGAMFIGVSSTNGAGASRKEFSFYEKLKTKIQKQKKLTVTNVSINGSNDYLFDNFFNEWVQYNPRNIVFIIHPLFFNENEVMRLISSKENKERKFILIVRPIPRYIKEDLENQKQIEAIDQKILSLSKTIKSQHQNIAIFNLSNSFNDLYGKHHLFWDDIHYTDYAHHLVSELIWNKLQAELI